jgi:PPP family 3-phenylpropionic acid transporter
MSPLWRFVVLYALMYAAFGVASPFMPAFFEARGLAPEHLGVLFGAGTAIRLLSGPVAGRVADLTQARRAVLTACTALAALVTFALIPGHRFWTLVLISLCQAAVLAPITTLADALALGAATPRDDDAARGFEYGWVRGTGSGLFIVGTLVSGQVVSAFGLTSIAVLQAGLLAAGASAAVFVPELVAPRVVAAADEAAHRGDLFELLAMPPFRSLMLVSALVLGSHAMHDAFAVIRWSAAGVGPVMASVLWSESVAAEVVIFFLVGPVLVERLSPPGAMGLAAAAGVVRWVTTALTAKVMPLALVQPLHGLTFAGLHLACMRLMTAIVPPGLAATAQAMYAFSAGATTALLTWASGALYGRLGAQGFLVMALLSAVAVPLTLRLRRSTVSEPPVPNGPHGANSAP